jgi:hypothetical protein
VIVIRCGELTTDEQLALAESITEGMGGEVLALARGKDVVLDRLGEADPGRGEVEAVVRDFLSRRADAAHYSYEWDGDDIVIHSADPVRAERHRRAPGLPDNLYKCPFCPFVTPYEEAYVVHYRSHGFA